VSKLAESDAQYRKRRAREDAQAIKAGRAMAQSDQFYAMNAPMQLRQVVDNSGPEFVPVGNGVSEESSVGSKQIDRLVHGAKMVGDPEYAKMFTPKPLPGLKRTMMEPFMPQEVAGPEEARDGMFNADNFNNIMALNKSKYYNDMVDDYYTLNRQNMDIEMMNSGRAPKKPINPKTGKPFETMERYNAIQELKRGMLQARVEEQDGKSYTKKMKLRRAEDSPLPGDVVDAKLEPGEYVLNRNAVKAIGKKRLDEINNKIKPRFSDKIKSKASRFSDDVNIGSKEHMWKKYLQTGGEVIDLTGQEDELGFGEDPIADAEQLGEETIAKGYEFGKKALGGAKDFLGKAYSRFGGDAYKASKTMNIMEGATDSEGNPISIEQAKKMRDEYGLGKGSLGMALGQGGQRLVDDAQTALGAGVAGAGAIANKAQELYGKASDKYQAFKPKAKKYLESDKFSEHSSKGLGMMSEMFHNMAALQGFDRPDMPKAKELEQVSDEKVPKEDEIPDTIKRPDYSTDPDVVAEEQAEQEAIENLRVSDPYIARPESQEPQTLDEITNPLGGITGQGGQEGGFVTMQGFIKQSLRNMYG